MRFGLWAVSRRPLRRCIGSGLILIIVVVGYFCGAISDAEDGRVESAHEELREI